mgnify:CR=1 FL=1
MRGAVSVEPIMGTFVELTSKLRWSKEGKLQQALSVRSYNNLECNETISWIDVPNEETQ